jgi:FKBP-type peptidyl-prolyl cis-trans isomerase SlyD
MIISNDKVVSIEYTLKDAEGEVLDSSEGVGPLEYIHGHKNLIPGLERELAGKKAGDSFSVTIEPKDAYGEYSKELLVSVSKEQFPSDVEIEVGMQFEAGNQAENRLVTVVEISDTAVTIDANHPLAGETLYFDVNVTDVRDATDEELRAGLLDGCGCGCGDHGCGDGCGCGDDDEGCGCSGGCGCH